MKQEIGILSPGFGPNAEDVRLNQETFNNCDLFSSEACFVQYPCKVVLACWISGCSKYAACMLCIIDDK